MDQNGFASKQFDSKRFGSKRFGSKWFGSKRYRSKWTVEPMRIPIVTVMLR
ncbi:hypothetical protein Hanom_Chr06g00477991 [Helianthus anomalus]